MEFTYKFYLGDSKNAFIFYSKNQAYKFAVNAINDPSRYNVAVYDNNGLMIHDKIKLKDVFAMPKKRVIKDNIYKDIFPRTNEPNTEYITYENNLIKMYGI